MSQLGRVRTKQSINHFSVMEEEKCRHGSDAELLAHALQLFDVELDKVDVFELLREAGGEVSPRAA